MSSLTIKIGQTSCNGKSQADKTCSAKSTVTPEDAFFVKEQTQPHKLASVFEWKLTTVLAKEEEEVIVERHDGLKTHCHSSYVERYDSPGCSKGVHASSDVVTDLTSASDQSLTTPYAAA